MNKGVIFAIYQMHKQPIIDLAFESRVREATLSTEPKKKQGKRQARRVLTRKVTGKKGLKASDYGRLNAAIRWVTAMLVDSIRGGRRQSIVIPLGHSAYVGRLFGHKLVNRVLAALEHMNYIKVVKAEPSKHGGYATHITADKRLQRAYSGSLIHWMRHPKDDRFKEIRLTEFDDFLEVRNTHPVPKSAETEQWRKNLETINQFNQMFPIFLQENDSTIFALLRDTYVDFTETRYRRVFCRGRLDHGGRFYGPWWQSIAREYRSTISIGHETVVEYDYSGMGVNLAYAIQGIAPPDDPYDIGLSSDNHEEKREVLKTVILALLNDEFNKYGLSKKNLKVLGVSHSQAMRLIERKHSSISHLFHTNVGLMTQFLDSKIAEKIMLEGVARDFLILSVHDSFIVQERHEQALLDVMERAYEEVVGRKPKIKWCERKRVPQVNLPLDKSRYLRFFHDSFANPEIIQRSPKVKIGGLE
jgi:hypothetical protein